MPDRLTPPLGPDDHVDGPPDAPLELVMYGDFQCPFCAAAQPILARVRDRLDGRLRFAFRHFPLEAIHPDAERAAEAAEAAAAQGAFWADARRAVRPARAARAWTTSSAPRRRLGLDGERDPAPSCEAGTHAARVRPTWRAATPAAWAARRRSSSTACATRARSTRSR